MLVKKILKDHLKKFFFGKTVPKELFDLAQYFRMYGPIEFKEELLDGEFIVRSTNYRFGVIITSAKKKNELEKNIIDAILTAFDVSAVYTKEAGIKQVEKTQNARVLSYA